MAATTLLAITTPPKPSTGRHKTRNYGILGFNYTLCMPSETHTYEMTQDGTRRA